ncbi:MAG: serine--tRNA ligase [Nitrososphaerota archaeon]|nr:serine--tRNA ligase [Nitrososphaerota archaeon]MDG6939396.1 serine--tRNA ligase [Nitrososphaerota archaeon]
MLDFKFIRENRATVEGWLRKRRTDYPLDRLLTLDARRRAVITSLQELRHRRNVVTGEVAAAKKAGRDASAQIRDMKAVGDRIAEMGKELAEVEKELGALELRMPNAVHESVPDCAGEEESAVVRAWGEPKAGPAKDHIDIGVASGVIDMEKAAETSGARFYYLKGALVRLNYALLQYAIEFGASKGFLPMQPPYMLKGAVMRGAVDMAAFEDSIYKLEGEDLYLLSTSEHALLAYHSGEILPGVRLPIRYLGVSSCFRREAGAHGRDTKGIFRVHEFEKVEQFVFCRPEDSWKEHELLASNAEEFFRSLGIPHRLVNICSGDLGAPAAKKYDLEAWLPGQGKYREMVSASNCTDWQARRLSVKFRDKMGDEPVHVHTLNSTLVATERAMVAIMENYQRPDGGFDIPEALRKYMGGQTTVSPPA